MHFNGAASRLLCPALRVTLEFAGPGETHELAVLAVRDDSMAWTFTFADDDRLPLNRGAVAVTTCVRAERGTIFEEHLTKCN